MKKKRILTKNINMDKSVPFSALNKSIYRIGMQFILEDECLIRAKDKKTAIKFVKQLYKNKAIIKTGKESIWKVNYDMLDNISKKEILDTE